MNNKLLLPVLAVLALAIGALWYTTSGDDAYDTDVQALDVDGTPRPLSPDDGDSLPSALVAQGERAPESAGEPDARREVVAEEAEEIARTKPRSNAVWVTGRVVFPERMPNEIGEVTVTARGRRFGTSSRREHAVTVERDGAFRVAFSESTKIGWLSLQGRYVYLSEKVRVDVDELPDEVVIEPEMGGVIRGRVAPPAGLAWTAETREDARVSIRSWSGGGMVTRQSDIDAEGGFQLVAVPPGEYDVQVGVPYWADARESDVKVRSGETEEIELKLEAGSLVTGRVLDEDDGPLPDVSVELTGSSDSDGFIRVFTKTEADGSFALRGVAEGELQVKAVQDERLVVEKKLGFLAMGSQRTGLELRLEAGNSIRGEVRWPDGTPVAGAYVTISQQRETEGLVMDWNDAEGERTEDDGTFEISGLESAACTVRAQARSFRPKDLAKAKEREKEGRRFNLRARGPTYKVRVDDVRPGTSGLVLVLDQGDAVRGTVLDDLGEGLTRFVVSADPESGEGLSDEDAVRRIVISLDGSFTVDGLREGTWKIRAMADDHQPTEEVTVQIPGAQELALVAPRLAELQGVVRSPGGEPISGASVYVDTLDESEEFSTDGIARRWGEDATTNQDGKFTAKDVRPGRLRVSAKADGFAVSPAQLVLVEPGSETEGVSLVLRRGAEIRGQLHATVGELGERKIQMRAEGEGNFWGNATTDASGSFEFEGLDPGSYRLTLEGGDDAEGLSKTIAEVVTLSVGEKRTVLLGAPPANPTTVQGVVRAGGAPAAGMVVRARAEKDGQMNNDVARTDGEGRYALTLAGAGSYSFDIGEAEGSKSRFSRELGEGENPAVDFDLAIGVVEGLVIGIDGEPLKGCDVTLVVVELEEHAHPSSQSRNVSTNDAGEFRFTYVPAGRYYLRAHGRVWGRWQRRTRTQPGTQIVEGVVVPADGAAKRVDVRLYEEGVISGSVTGSDGLPASGVRLQATTADGTPIHTSSRVSTDSSGTFRYNALPSGRVLISAGRGDERGPAVSVDVSAGSTSSATLSVNQD